MELINRYRPQNLEEVIGHDAVVRSLKTSLKKGLARTYLFTGPSGVGKTTLAYIMAREVGCLPGDRVDVNAATNTGIEDMRGVIEGLMFRPIGEGSVKAVIIDEAHALSKPAIQSLLKILEEPPDWVYWFLCTTEPSKILPTIKTRSLHCDLKPVAKDLLEELLERVEDDLKLECAEGVIGLCATEAAGSVRQALSNFAVCSGVNSLKEAKELLQSAEGSAEAIDLARALIRRAAWGELQAILRKMKETNPESVRHVVRAYMTSVILNAKTERDAGKAMEVLDVFSQPFYSSDGVSPLVMACGKICFAR